jgi:hypothetical protein
MKRFNYFEYLNNKFKSKWYSNGLAGATYVKSILPHEDNMSIVIHCSFENNIYLGEQQPSFARLLKTIKTYFPHQGILIKSDIPHLKNGYWFKK